MVCRVHTKKGGGIYLTGNCLAWGGWRRQWRRQRLRQSRGSIQLGAFNKATSLAAAQHAQQRGCRHHQAGAPGHPSCRCHVAQGRPHCERRQCQTAGQQLGRQARCPLPAPLPPKHPAAHLTAVLVALLAGYPLLQAGLVHETDGAGAEAGPQQAPAQLAGVLRCEADAADGALVY